MSSELPSSQPPLSLQFGDSQTTGGSQSFTGYVAGPVHFQSSQDPLHSLPSAEGASFNSQELEHERRCLAGTRTEVLELIEQWRTDPQGERIFWLSGMAGTGKSTIARTIAHKLSKKKLLGASFFFSRGRGDRGNASKFFTSIAYQLALWNNENEALARVIREAIHKHPNIAKRAKHDQWKHLIQEPLSQMKNHSAHRIVLIFVIDALDECEDDRDVQLILKILSEAKSFDHIQFRVFMTGRPSISVHDAFLEKAYQNLILHKIERYIVQRDLRIFFESELRSIQKKHRLNDDFLGKGDIETLVQRAGELFIYATTICLFIGERKPPPPRERLKIILRNNGSANPALKNLDQLYIQILREVVPKTDSTQDKTLFCSHFRVIVGSIVNLFSSLSVSSLAALLFVELVDVNLVLDSLWSILDVPPQESKATIALLHPSFRDFLLDTTRCTDLDFWVDSAKIHVALTEHCLSRMVASLKRDICDLKLPGTLTEEIDSGRVREHIPAELEYACMYWVRHLESGLQAGSNILEHNLLDRIREFLNRNILYWFEALSLLGKMEESVLMLSKLLALARSCDDRRLADFVHDAYRFSLEHRFIIEQAPLQTYHSALMFSPSSSLLRNFFQIPYWVNCVSKIPNDWGSLLQTLEGHAYRVTSVTFSPSGQKLASASPDGIVRVWDTASGLPLQTLETYRYYDYASVAFSPDGQKLASACGIGGIQIWDVASGSLFKTFEDCFILSIAFSPDEQKLASGCGDDLVRIWDAASGAVLHKIKARHVISVAFSPKGQKLASASRLDSPAIRVWDVASGSRMQSHGGYFTSVVFSPDGKKLVCGSGDGRVCVWDGASRVPLFTLVGHTSKVTSVVVSGQKLASGSMDRTLCIWDLVSGSLLRKFEGHSQGITSVAFSPDGQKLVSGSSDHTIRVWDVAPGSSLQEFERHPSYVTSVAFSPSGQKVASGSEDGTVNLWDSESGSLLQKLGGDSGPVSSLAFSPSGQKVASGSGYGTVNLWDSESGSLLQKLGDDSGQILSLAFSSNDQNLVYVSLFHTIKVWNIRHRLLICKINTIREEAESVAFSPDGKKIVSPCRSIGQPRSVSIRVWDVARGTQLREFEGSDMIRFKDSFEESTSVAFSPDGQKLVATWGNYVSVWDSASGWQLQPFEGHPDWVRSSAILTAKQPRALNVFGRWVEVSQKRLIWLPPARRASVFVTSGTKIAIGSPSGIVTILNLDFEKMDLLTSPPSPSYARARSPSDVYDTGIDSVEDEHVLVDIKDSVIEDVDEGGDDDD